MILVVGGIKGGSGKTTIATNLVVMCALNKKKVLLVDADEQGTSTFFSKQRDRENSELEIHWTTAQLSGENIHNQLKRFKPDYDDIIVDVGGRDNVSLRSSLFAADIFLVPFKPSSYDIWTIAHVRSLITDIKPYNPKMKVITFINQADFKGEDNKIAMQILDEYQDINCLDITVGNRKAFRNSACDGMGVVEQKIQDKKAIQEMKNLYDCIYKKKNIKSITEVQGKY